MKSKLLTTAFILIISLTFATVRLVPLAYPTIQGALAACLSGDTVRVQPGIYLENIVWPNTANIKLLAVGDSSNTTINGNHTGTVLVFNHPIIDTNTVIKGFKITNGYLNASTVHGGGVQITSCSPKFSAVAITGNHIGTTNWGYGAGIYASVTSMVIVNSTINGNVVDSCSWGYGGGVHLEGAGAAKFRNVKMDGNTVNSDSWCHGVGLFCATNNATFSNCSASNNNTGPNASWFYGGGMYFETCTVTLFDVKVVSNALNNLGSYYYGAGLHFHDCTAKLINSLVTKNTLGTGGNFYNGAGIYTTYASGPMNLKIINSTIADNNKSDNSSFSGAGIYSSANCTDTIINSILYNPNPGLEMNILGGYLIQYSDVRGGVTGTGNINSLPAFISATDYHLSASSLCVNSGTLSAAPPLDLDGNPRPSPIGTNPDMGCYERGCTPPAVNINLSASLDTVCTSAGIINLTGATPAGGTYSGIGVSGNTFNASTATLGNHTIMYSFTDSTGCTGLDSSSIFVQNCAGVGQIDFESGVIVFPNPANDVLTVVSGTSRIINIVLTNIIGEQIQNIIVNDNAVTIDLTGVSNGVYFIQIRSDEQIVVNNKIIKQ